MADLDKLLKNYKILYCEDEQLAREKMIGILYRKTKNIVVAQDGKEGLEKFKTEDIDIVITDISMPRLGGLEMIAKIREIDEKIPVVITTAYSDQDLFMKSIALKVDEYLIKPIMKSSLFEKLEKIVTNYENQKAADEYKIIQEREKLKTDINDVIIDFSDSFPQPIVILSGRKTLYINDNFKTLLGEKETIKLLEGKKSMDSLLEEREDFCTSFDLINSEVAYQNRVSMDLKSGRRVFQVTIKDLDIKSTQEKETLYIFTDITLCEYQRVKIRNYSELLEDFIIRNKDEIQNQEELQRIETVMEEESPRVRELSKEETEILRRSHLEKIHALEFTANLDAAILTDLEELAEVEYEMDRVVADFNREKDSKTLFLIANKFDKYASTIKKIEEFDELAKALFSVRDVLSSVVHLEDKTIKIISLYAENILQDLINWREEIFVKKETVDIHYLDSSLFSSCLQLELNVTGVKAEDDASEVEFF